MAERGSVMKKRIDLNAVPVVTGSSYPAPFDAPCAARARQRLGDAAGLTDFGVNYLRLPAGAWSSQRHWHTAEDEFVFVVEGEVVLITDSGEEILRAGDSCKGNQQYHYASKKLAACSHQFSQPQSQSSPMVNREKDSSRSYP